MVCQGYRNILGRCVLISKSEHIISFHHYKPYKADPWDILYYHLFYVVSVCYTLTAARADNVSSLLLSHDKNHDIKAAAAEVKSSLKVQSTGYRLVIYF